MSTIETLRHGRIDLALHRIRDGSGRPLLLLHGLGERSVDAAPTWAAKWTGPIVALDFTGHGLSTIPRGGGYSAEMLLADADVAMAALGEATVVGRGLGAYIALLLAGARAELVRGAVLTDGAGLAGGATRPTSMSYFLVEESTIAPDRYALMEMSRDLRPPDYASLFVRMAVEHSGLDEPITVAAVVRPPWLSAVADEVGVATTASIADALDVYQRVS